MKVRYCDAQIDRLARVD